MGKIAIITPFWTGTKGGISTCTLMLFNHLKNDHQVFVITPDQGEDSIRLKSRGIGMIISAIVLLNKISPDVIHIHAFGSLLIAAVIHKFLFSKRTGIVFTFHTQPRIKDFFSGKPSKNRSGFRIKILNYFLDQCKAVTFVSRSLYDSFKSTGLAVKTPVVIKNGVGKIEVDKEKVAAFISTYDLSKNHPVLCMLSNLSWDWKARGIELLIKSLVYIKQYHPSIKLLIVGAGKYLEYLETIVMNECLKNQVIFTGNLDNPGIALNACDIYCHISLNEACPLAILEAAVSGKPIVASNDGGIPEIIKSGFNGILTSSVPEEISKAIIGLIKDKELMKKISVNAEINMKRNYNWQVITKEYLKLYEIES